ncbi:MAG: SGNH/GDSL hydrolase family protein [Clostridia bacterium]|nr:SGNH/GDSL hydrolase family protein [Clostridia bacterium]
MKILFIGNSHTYFNEMPRMVRDLFASVGRRVEPVMQTEGGKGMFYHCERKDILFNVRHGDYDVIIMQDKATRFDAAEFAQGMDTLAEKGLSQTNARRLLYMPWANRGKPEEQVPMTAAYRAAAIKHDCTLVPVGEIWHALLAEKPELEAVLYREDGNHATRLGSYLAACSIFYVVSGRVRPLHPADDDALITRLGLDPELCRMLHKAACRGVREFEK